jgi:redox-sensing transcriptional repressor
LRKDLTYFGQFGTRGLGYPVTELSDKIVAALGTNHLQPVILVGVGNLGSALLAYKGFEKAGFEIVSAIDKDPKRKRSKDFPLPIHDLAEMEKLVEAKKIKMAILAVPATEAQEITNRLCQAGITAILNFAPIILQVPEHVIVNNVNLAIELENLSYFAK